MMKTGLRSTLAAVAVACSGLAGTTVSATPTVELDMASTFPTSMPILGTASQDLVQRIATMSDGTLVIHSHEPNTLVPAPDSVNAVADGRIEAAWAGAGWFAGRDTAFNMFSSVPFGPSMGEYLAWLYYGGGLELAREMFAEHGVYNIPCGMIPPEASGWFPEEIRSVQDLKGIRMRFFGLGAQVMQRLGVETQQLAPGEILAAVENGELDATEFSLPSMDQRLGFSKVLKYYYFPGWHQQATLFDLYIALDVWNEMSESHQTIVETACGDVIRDMMAKGEAMQWSAMQEMQAEGVELRRWPASILVELEDAWLDIARNEAANNPNFARVYASYSEFRENYKIWKHFSFLE